jgi:NADH:ubiquinone oxidoreductase subunit K
MSTLLLPLLLLQGAAPEGGGMLTPADWQAMIDALRVVMTHWFASSGTGPMRFFTYIDYHQYYIVSCFIFCLGFYGVVARRNAISMLLAMELMLNAVNINLSAFNQFWGPKTTLAAFTSEKTVYTNMGQAFSVFTIIVAAAEAAVGLAIIIAFYRMRKSILLDEANLMKG